MSTDEQHHIRGNRGNMIVYSPFRVVVGAIAAGTARIVMSLQRNAIDYAVVHNCAAGDAVVGGEYAEVRSTAGTARRHSGAIGWVAEGKGAANPTPAGAKAR